jgi:hypothetical protein
MMAWTAPAVGVLQVQQPKGENTKSAPSIGLDIAQPVEAVLPPALRRGQFKAPDALIAALLDPAATTQVARTLS